MGCPAAPAERVVSGGAPWGVQADGGRVGGGGWVALSRLQGAAGEEVGPRRCR